MQLLVIRPGPQDESPERIEALCAAAQLPHYEARSRIRVLGDWPGVLLSVAQLPRVIELEARLRRANFDVWTMPGRPKTPRLVVRRFALSDSVLRVEADGGEVVEVPLHAARLLLSVTGFRVDLDQVLEHDAGSGRVGTLAARALLGLPNRPSMARVVERKRARQERFVRLFCVGAPALEFRASALQYAALDEAPVAPTQLENFRRAMQRLRDALPAVTNDNRLEARSAQTRVLGPGLPPQQHLEAAIALLTREVVGPSDPYR